MLKRGYLQRAKTTVESQLVVRGQAVTADKHAQKDSNLRPTD